MEKYKILKNHVDFEFIEDTNINTIGSRNKRYKLSTLYDNGCNLLRYFK